ncbi:MAG: DUF3373 family protein [Deltaproteobacteria bacterium]|nr:DUF3373 family protein [Deltaproteobacteria bacterium]
MNKYFLFVLLTATLYVQTGVADDGEPLTGPEKSDAALPSPGGGETDAAPTREEYDELRERLDMMEGDIERLIGQQDKLTEKSLLDRLNWSGSYRFNTNFYHLTDKSFDAYPTHLEVVIGPQGPVLGPDGRYATEAIPAGYRNRKEWLSPSWTHRLKLAMTYDFGESLRFYSQLGVYKYFNETLNTIGLIDHGSNAYPRDNAFRLERVYFDWFVSDWLAFSIGRIASPDGPPTELRENQNRRSGWGVQMVNATIDTIMATVYLRDKMYLRTFYSPFGTHMDFAVNNDVSLFDDQGLDILHSWGALFETAIPKMEDSIFQLGFMHIPKFSPRDIDIVPPGTDLLLSPGEPTGQNLGSFLQASTLLLMKNLFDIGLDIFASYNLTMAKPTDSRMVYEYPVDLNIINPTTGEPQLNPATNQPIVASEMQELQIGLVSFDDKNPTATHFGHAVYGGLRYTPPLSENYPTRFGAEVNWGTRYHVAWSHPNDQLLNKLGNKGLAFEGYVIQQMVPKHLFCRVGYMELKRSYVGSFVGPTSAVDQRIRSIYFLVDLSW